MHHLLQPSQLDTRGQVVIPVSDDLPAADMRFLALTGLPEVLPQADLPRLILAALNRMGVQLLNGDILVLAQKVVSKSEGRFVFLDEVKPSARAVAVAVSTGKDPRVVELILAESRSILRERMGVIVVEDIRGFVLANAGIDASNVPSVDGRERVLLLPESPDRSAERIRQRLEAESGVRLGVLINDSLGRAWRNGTVGTALGVSGLPALLDLRGYSDREGRELLITEVGVADELAAAASLVMGQAKEGRPVILIRGFPHPLREGSAIELIRQKHMDLFR